MFYDKQVIGKKIKEWRVQKGLSQEKLAEAIGVTDKNISRIERGIQYPKAENLMKILDVLDIMVIGLDSCTLYVQNNPLRNKGLNIINSATDEELELIVPNIDFYIKNYKKSRKKFR